MPFRRIGPDTFIRNVFGGVTRSPFAPVRIVKQVISMPRQVSMNGRMLRGSSREARAFNKAAKAFTIKATRSSKNAMSALVEGGIYTKSGRLSKHYK